MLRGLPFRILSAFLLRILLKISVKTFSRFVNPLMVHFKETMSYIHLETSKDCRLESSQDCHAEYFQYYGSEPFEISVKKTFTIHNLLQISS